MTQTLKKYYISILLVIFGGIVLHAPISVALSSVWPEYGLIIKSWKEILMLVAGIMAVYIILKTKQYKIFSDPILIAIIIYSVLHVVLLVYEFQGSASAIAGLAIDLRYLLFFGLVYVAVYFYPSSRRLFLNIGLIGALIVVSFALLQVFVLPPDVLKYIGYGKNSIAPYLTIDKNSAFIRINSTLRGPNPLGAYAAMVLTLITAAVVKKKVFFQSHKVKIMALLLSIGCLVALWASYSRSAWLGAVVSVIIVLGAVMSKRLPVKMWVGIGTGVLAVFAVTALLFGGSAFVSNVILHENPSGGSGVNSNEGHANSLSDATLQLVKQPIGAGIGSTGSASLLGQRPEVIENQYLFITHEVGWLGLALFLYIFITIMIRLYKRRDDWLALGVLAGGIGLAVIGLLLPVWVDDTVSIMWWGLAALALAGVPRKGKYGKAKID